MLGTDQMQSRPQSPVTRCFSTGEWAARRRLVPIHENVRFLPPPIIYEKEISSSMNEVIDQRAVRVANKITNYIMAQVVLAF